MVESLDADCSHPWFRGFGPAAQVVGEVEMPIGGHRERALLAGLLLRPGQHHTTSKLADLIWPQSKPRDPSHAIRTLVMRLRRHLDTDLLQTTGGGYRIQITRSNVDVHCFERMVYDARDFTAKNMLEHSHRCLAGALELAGAGDPWQDIATSQVGRAASAKILELKLRAQEEQAEVAIRIGQPAIGMLTQLATEQPLRERRWCLLIAALYESGRQSEALRAVAEARQVLRDAAGVCPGHELVELEHKILAHLPLR